MKRLLQFFRRQLEKLFLWRPQVSGDLPQITDEPRQEPIKSSLNKTVVETEFKSPKTSPQPSLKGASGSPNAKVVRAPINHGRPTQPKIPKQTVHDNSENVAPPRLTDIGQPDMVSRSQRDSQASRKLQELPYNSTSLRNYLESTSNRGSTPRPATSPNRVQNKQSSIAARPSHSRRPVVAERRPVEDSVHSVRPPSAQKTPPSTPKSSTSKLHKIGKEKTPESSFIQVGEPSIITMIEVSESTKSVIVGAMQKFGMKVQTTEGYWNVCWSDNAASIQDCKKLQKYQRINRFPGTGMLLTKNNLARYTNKMRQTFPEDYNFVPETWCLPGELTKVEQYARLHENDCFIVKPNDGSSGRGIIITRNMARLKLCERMVCQVYVRRPYLIDGFKFDLRVYTLITSCRPLRLFVYNEALARFATERYEQPNQNNESNRFMHLTNYAVNKHSPMYTVGETKGTLRRLTTINKCLQRQKVDTKKVWESMDDVIVKTIISFLPALKHNYRVSFPEQTESNSCFQMLGFDIMFDDRLKPYVLEVNDSPSLKADAPLDKEMTRALIIDTFNILHLGENNRSKMLSDERRQSRNRLLSSTENRSALNKEKERNEKSLTQSRIEWENTHMGNFRKVFPNEQKLKHYKKYMTAAQEIFDRNG